MVSGTIEMTSGLPLFERIRELHHGLEEIIDQYRPDVAAVERIFFAKSVRSALVLGHARGVALLAIAEAGVEFYEYTPAEVKKAVAGYGRAGKRQVQEMVRRVLGLELELSPDGADALALAICHMNMARFVSKVDT
jgi:crossover junction endodeoxyribonuclease RuvC